MTHPKNVHEILKINSCPPPPPKKKNQQHYISPEKKSDIEMF